MEQGKLERIANGVAYRYKQRCWWADMEELKHEAVLAMLGAEPNWDSRVGVPLEGYLWQAASFALKKYVLRQSAPVSASNGAIDELKGLRRAPVDDEYEKPGLSIEDELHQMRIRDTMRMRIARVLMSVEAEDALSVLAREEKSGDLAKRTGMPLKKVYSLVNRARNAIRYDLRLWQLWKEEVY